LIRERLSLQGNPAVNDDWWLNPKTGEQVDFIDFARSEGRFGKHFDKDGNPSETLLRAKQDRLENWQLLQELAGLRGGTKAPAKPAGKADAAKPAAEAPAAKKAAPVVAKQPPKSGNGHPPAKGGKLPEGFAVGTRIKYRDGASWIAGVVDSLDPAVISFDDDTEIRTSSAAFADGVKEGLIVAQ
jgi:hypothetical protein